MTILCLEYSEEIGLACIDTSDQMVASVALV